MSEVIEIVGGQRLSGRVRASGAKNAALPMLIASLLTPEKCIFSNVPNLKDVSLVLHLLKQFGATVSFADGQVVAETPSLVATEASYSLVKALRASFWVLGPLLARGGAARVALPGGDLIGARPVDMHISALTKMGADIKVKHGIVYASAPDGLRAVEHDFRFPSVGATHQIMMAAALTPGSTVIRGAAREPEIVALGEMLSAMGAGVSGHGSSEVVISGTPELCGCNMTLIGDRIEAATYLLAGVATQGDVTVTGIDPLFLGSFLKVLEDMEVGLETSSDSVRIVATKRPRAVHVSTEPFPGFATDIQASLMAALTLADGESQIEEHIFEGRFGHVSELCRMGADIRVDERFATIRGVEHLNSAPVEALDIRAGAAMVIAGLAANGTTEIHEPQHLRRGYARLEEKFGSLGATFRRKLTDPEDYMFTGC